MKIFDSISFNHKIESRQKNQINLVKPIDHREMEEGGKMGEGKRDFKYV